MKKFGEHDISYAILFILDKYGQLDTGSLKDLLRTEFIFEDENRAPLMNRNDEKVDQIIRNIVSHRKSSTNIINKGWINYDDKKILSITSIGKEILKTRLL